MLDSNGHFPTTQWSVLRQAALDTPEAREALERLCQVYWFPIYVYARRQGFRREDARDATQQFFIRFLERNYLSLADRRRGRFRSFLLTCLKHFLADEWDKLKTVKRGGSHRFLAWDHITPEQERACEDCMAWPSDNVFDRQWAYAVMEEALRTLRQQYQEIDKGREFAAYKTFLTNLPVNGEYAALAEQFQLSVNSVTVAVHRFRQQFREILREQVVQTIYDPNDLEEELRYLTSLLLD